MSVTAKRAARVLVAGVGNILRGDDGFGVVLAQRLIAANMLGPEVTVGEFGIGGISLVQDLMDGYDALIVIDAVERGGAPGTLHVLEASVVELSALSDAERRDFLSDMHYTNPARALVFAKALGVLPGRVIIIGVQPSSCDEVGVGLSAPVEAALERAQRELHVRVRALVDAA